MVATQGLKANRRGDQVLDRPNPLRRRGFDVRFIRRPGGQGRTGVVERAVGKGNPPDAEGRDPRITSYNVCYTKLLRGRNAERPPLTLEAVRENAETYAEQIFRVVDRERAEMRRQSEWYGALSLAETLSLAGSFSLAHMLSHETFRQRYEGGARVGIHELLYPILQSYDSVVVGADSYNFV